MAVLLCLAANLALPFRFFVRTEAGAKVSFWDLYNYVYHNPELAALAKNTHAVVPALGDDAASASGSVGGAVPPGYVAPGLYSDPGPGAWRVLDQEAAKQMPWVSDAWRAHQELLAGLYFHLSWWRVKAQQGRARSRGKRGKGWGHVPCAGEKRLRSFFGEFSKSGSYQGSYIRGIKGKPK